MFKLLQAAGICIGIVAALTTIFGRDNFLQFMRRIFVRVLTIKLLLMAICGFGIGGSYILYGWLAHRDIDKAADLFQQIWWTDTYFGLFAAQTSFFGWRTWVAMKRIEAMFAATEAAAKQRATFEWPRATPP